MLPHSLRTEWFSNIRGDILAGIVVALALIPEALVSKFDFKEAISSVRLDLSHAHFRDITAIEALDRIVDKFQRNGITVETVGLNRASTTMVEKYATHVR